MREAGFEPAHPEIVGLKSTALDHSAIRAKRRFVTFLLLSPFRKKTSYIYNILQLLILKIVKISERVYAKKQFECDACWS